MAKNERLGTRLVSNLPKVDVTQGLRCRVQGLGIYGLGFRVQGLRT